MNRRFLPGFGTPRGTARRTGVAVVASLSLVMLYALPASAVHDTGVFQLDGDASSATDPISPPATDDWNNVCHQVTVTNDTTNQIPDECATSSDTTNATAVSWTAEPNTSASIFTGGGSKDPIDISSWAWKDAGGLPDKDNLIHSFAARYSLADDPVGGPTACPAGTNPTGKCELLVFGSDRFDNSGDAQQGFWFFQNRITTNGAKSGGGTGFTGVHKNGDILVISDFSNGGTTSTITVYRWDSTCTKTGAVSTLDGTVCGDANLAQLETSSAAKCSNALGAGDPFCGIVNPTNGTVAPWTYTDKSGFHTYLNGEFYEGGINLSLLPGGIASECFASVASETRSSTSTTAVLKDFVLGNFGDCSATLATQVSATPVLPGVAVHDTATVTGSASSITPTGNVTFFLCSFAFGTTDVCDDSDAAHHGTQLTPNGTLSGSGKVATADSPDVNTAAAPKAPGRYCFRAEWPGDTNYVGALKEFSGATECFTVKDTTSLTTAQNWLPNDSATITSTGGTAVSGTLDFTLFDGAGCTGTALYTEPTITLSGAASPTTRSTGNTSVTVTTSKTVYWKVVFSSSDPLVDSPPTSSQCVESTALTIVNAPTP